MKQARTLEREHYGSFYRIPNTVANLTDKAAAVLATGFAARTCEVIAVKFEDVLKTTDRESGEERYIVEHMRAKTTGVPVKMRALISGALEVSILNQYISCFPLRDRTGRFFRVLKYGADSTIVGTFKVVGKNTFSDTAKRIARLLGLDQPDLYTGHCFRRSAATMCAEMGMTLPEIKLVTGK